jgi:SAM-dependent methyltransferase
MDADADRWDERYRSVTTVEPVPPEPLAVRPDLLDLFPRTGVALDLACGTGGQTLWLAERGLQVTALDVSPVAVQLVRDAVRVRRLGERVDARVADLEAGLPTTTPVIAQAIVCQRYRQPTLYPQIVDRLAPGGLAFVTVLSQVGAAAPGPFHAPPDELAQAFNQPGLEVLHHLERDGTATVVVRRTTATVR